MTKTNKLNLVCVSIIAILAYLLNQCMAVYQCAAMFTAVILIVNTFTFTERNTQKYNCLVLGVTASLPVYFLTSSLFNLLTITSLASLLISGIASIYVANKLKNTHSRSIALFISLLVAAILDGLLMSSYFSMQTNFSFTKIINIFNRELFFKSVYGAVSALIIYSLGIYEQRKSKMV